MKKTLFTLAAAIACCGTAVSADDPNSPPNSLIFSNETLGESVTLVLTEATLGDTGESSTTAAGVTTNKVFKWDTSQTPNTNTFAIVFQLDAHTAPSDEGNRCLISAKKDPASTDNNNRGLCLALTSDGKLIFTSTDGNGRALLNNEKDGTSLAAGAGLATTVGHVYMWSYVYGTNTEYIVDLTSGESYVCELNSDGMSDANKVLTSDNAKVWTDSNKNHITLLGVADLSQTLGSMDSAGIRQVLTTAKFIPEPATATLSLLALAGLAARRRRK